MTQITSNTWRDDPAGATYGPGVSRAADGAAVRAFRLRVKQPHETALIVTLHAETKAKAQRYAQNRWPTATVQLLS